jgi:asparagine synthase (glutamine-hydrolysing)
MCGIAGFVLKEGRPEAALRKRATVMNDAIAHRGPDGEGLWLDAEAGVALTQRRLAIIDLSETGAQPMVSASGRLVMTYNGEIYNYRELRAELEREGTAFRGTSDSEVLLEAWDRWGEERTLAALNGMFAIAIWDRKERRLTLARDPFGIKPLVWTKGREGFFFASELKALRKDPACPRAIDQAAATAYLRHGAVPAPWTILAGVRKLEPGSVLRWSPGREPVIHRFWSPLDAMRAGQKQLSTKSLDELAVEGEALIGDAVERQMVSDVPLGAFLSGGIDSSLVVALMQQRAGRAIDSFTIGFEEPEWDESPHAEAVARHLGTRHHTLRTSGREALALAEGMAAIYDEPFADSSQIPTLLLCRLVRDHVTVALSGDGGDETFAGYARYDWGLKLAAYRERMPGALRRGASTMAQAMPMSVLDRMGAALAPAGRNAGHKLQRAAAIGAASDFAEGYRQFLSLTADPGALLANAGEHHPLAYEPGLTKELADDLSRMQAIDALSYLPDDILVKVDRASMSVGLEVRVPLLDHRIWEWAATLPAEAKRREGRGKAVLRTILGKHVPADVLERPKAGFAVPLASWLRTDLKAWADATLSGPSLTEGGVFNGPAVRTLWSAHLSGSHDHAPVLWSILMLEHWRQAMPDAV